MQSEIDSQRTKLSKAKDALNGFDNSLAQLAQALCLRYLRYTLVVNAKDGRTTGIRTQTNGFGDRYASITNHGPMVPGAEIESATRGFQPRALPTELSRRGGWSRI